MRVREARLGLTLWGTIIRKAQEVGHGVMMIGRNGRVALRVIVAVKGVLVAGMVVEILGGVRAVGEGGASSRLVGVIEAMGGTTIGVVVEEEEEVIGGQTIRDLAIMITIIRTSVGREKEGGGVGRDGESDSLTMMRINHCRTTFRIGTCSKLIS